MSQIQNKVAEKKVKRIKGCFAGWGTKDEIKYIRWIGLHRDGKFLTLDDRIRLFENYIASLSRRFHWGNINKEEVLKAATEGLEMLKKDAPRRRLERC